MSETYTPDNLVAGDFALVTRSVTIASGQNLARGAVLGKITASGKFVLSDPAATDGSQTPTAILAEAVDASGADKVGVAYLTGEFVESELTLGGAHTVDSIRDGLRDLSIFLKTAV